MGCDLGDKRGPRDPVPAAVEDTGAQRVQAPGAHTGLAGGRGGPLGLDSTVWSRADPAACLQWAVDAWLEGAQLGVGRVQKETGSVASCRWPLWLPLVFGQEDGLGLSPGQQENTGVQRGPADPLKTSLTQRSESPSGPGLPWTECGCGQEALQPQVGGLCSAWSLGWLVTAPLRDDATCSFPCACPGGPV